ncbi:hypothetical protein QTI66_39290 [Variovorax sp. J22R133]|uniref:hypothetical protein n=1 Tax=Variovorax brevis TaxID=3053503 RepID=UPI002576B7F4|nr:hypothetical protein [Variovorax sp. J22R133]MDM0118115.1 hypothetical protein [Variovorax sp. J22R133]
MKAPHAPRHSGVRTNASAHQVRQRSRVRSGIASPASSAALEFEPACRLELTTTISAKYTRRPKKRTDVAVVRLRHEAQQKLKRCSKLDRNSGRQPRGLRG